MVQEDMDTISEKKILDLLMQLAKDKTTVQMVLIGRGYERLTMISEIRSEGGKTFVLMDLPRSFSQDVPDPQQTGIKVEFLGKDKIQHTFSSTIAKVSATDMWLELPIRIERIQRRNFFRIAPPVGTRISFLKMGNPVEVSLVNLSEGGALVTSRGIFRGALKLKVGDEIRNLKLQCKLENLRAEIKIGKAVVLREHTAGGLESPTCALQFLEMEPRDKRALQEFIFKCQREVLAKSKLSKDTSG